METFSKAECQICFNPFSLQRQPKLLECKHTCCSVCLHQIVLNHKEVSCPWCRHVTQLCGLSVFQLPDDPEALSAITLAQTPVFILPNSGCYLPPLSAEEYAYQYCQKQPDRTAQPERLATTQEEAGEGRNRTIKSSTWTKFCTVLLVVIILFFFLAIILHNMSCVSKRFNIITCG